MTKEHVEQLGFDIAGFEEQRIFADENARIGWETSRAVDRIAETLPPEGQGLNAKPIRFEEVHELRGLHAVFTAGTVIFTSDLKGTMLVPERTLQILGILGIPYDVGFPES